MNEPAVRITGLSKVYPGKGGGTTAVDGLSIDISPGEIFGLLGPNGAGKTTTVRILCGLIAPTGGTAFVDGISVRDNPDGVRARIGLVPEDAGDYKNLTLAEELEYHGAMYGLDRATVRRRSEPLIRRLDLQGRSGDRLKTFSRGMRRKFHLIRALLHQPRVLLLDEPTAGLDPSIVEEVWDLLKALAAEHQVTVILCSHHLEEVERLCSRVAILKTRLLAQGSLAELSGGQRRYRMELLGDATAAAAIAGQVAGVERAAAEGMWLQFEVARSPEQVLPEVVRRVVAGGGSVLGLTRQERDLRSLYRQFVESPGTGGGNGQGGGHV
jgi:ABC-2 type transport system ATP-binding protein